MAKSRRSGAKKKRWTVDAFERHATSTHLPLVALGGKERGFVLEALGIITEHTLGGGLADFNHDKRNARQHAVGDAISAAATLPVMAEKRLVEVIEAERWGTDAVKPLLAYLDAGNDTTTLVLVFDKLDGRNKLVQALEKAGVLFRFEHPTERELVDILPRRGKKHGLHIDHEIADALVMAVGPDVMLMERALEKLALVVEPGARVTVADVAEHVASTRLEDAFALGRAVAQADRASAMMRLNNLRRAREAPLKLVGMLSWQLRQVHSARAYLDAGDSPQDIGQRLRLFGGRLSTVMRAAERWPAAAHARRLRRLSELDTELKSSRADGWRLLEHAVLQLCPAPRR